MLEPAPLIETSEATAPDGAEPGWYAGAGGARLRAAVFRPKGRVRGSVVLSGGRTEPIEKYYETIGDFLARDMVVLAHDWRGQGLSQRELRDRLKGHASGYRTFLQDFRALLAAYERDLPKPWVAVGHSMGGCLTLLAMAHGERRFAGALLSAPMLGVLTGRVPQRTAAWLARLNVLMGRRARYILGQAGQPFADDFEANVLTHDRRRFQRTASLLASEPQLALGAPTWGWLDFALRATAFLARPDALREVTAPVVIVSAGEDRLVDNAAQAAAARHLPQGKHIVIPGAFHEILMETDEMRNVFLRLFDAMIGRVAPKPSEGPKPAPATPPAAAEQAPEPVKAEPAAPPAAAAQPAPVAAAKPAAAKKPATKKPAAKATAPKTATAKTAAKPSAARAAANPTAKAATAEPAAKPAAKKAPTKPAAVKAAAAKKAAAKPAATATPVKKPAAKPANKKPPPKP